MPSPNNTHTPHGQTPEADKSLELRRKQNADHAFQDVQGGQHSVRGRLDSLGIPGLHDTADSPRNTLATADTQHRPETADRERTQGREDPRRQPERKLRFSADHGHDAHHAPAAHAPAADAGPGEGWNRAETSGLALGLGTAGVIAANGWAPALPAVMKGTAIEALSKNILLPAWEGIGAAATYAGEVTGSLLASAATSLNSVPVVGPAAAWLAALNPGVLTFVGSAVGGGALLWGMGRIRRAFLNSRRRAEGLPDLPGGLGTDIGHGLKLIGKTAMLPVTLAGKAWTFIVGTRGGKSIIGKTTDAVGKFFAKFDTPGGKAVAGISAVGAGVLALGLLPNLAAVAALPAAAWGVRKAWNFFSGKGGGGAAHAHDDHGHGGH